MRAGVSGRKVEIGADRLMRDLGLAVDIFARTAERLSAEGKTPIYAAIDGRIAAVIVVADPVKETSAEAIARLKRLGVSVAMVTGDNRGTAEAIARIVGIDHVVAEVLPEGKVKAIRQIRAESGDTGHGKTRPILAFVGDGINDAPALAEADIGIAIGTGTDVAIESADVVLVGGDLNAIAAAIAVSRATMVNIRQNLAWASAITWR